MNILTYENIQERKTHGELIFPFNIYPCSIPVDFASVPLHWHNDMEIIYVKKGRGVIDLDLTPHPARAGDILLVPPGHLHAIRRDSGGYMEYENIIFQLSLLMNAQADFCSAHYFAPLLQGRIPLMPHVTADHPLHPRLSGCLDEIDAFSALGTPLSTLAIKARLFDLFHLLFSCLEETAPVPAPKPSVRSLELVKLLLKYVEEHYQERLTIEKMAGVCGFSPSHFMKFFRQTMGVSFIGYLNDYRLTMAARLLLASTDTIVAVASECGFENLSYFNRIFKRKYKVTPSQYRKNSPAINASDYY